MVQSTKRIGIIKAVVCTVLSVGWCIKYMFLIGWTGGRRFPFSLSVCFFNNTFPFISD